MTFNLMKLFLCRVYLIQCEKSAIWQRRDRLTEKERWEMRGDNKSKCKFERERVHSTSWQAHSRCTDDILMVVDFYYDSVTATKSKHWTKTNPKIYGRPVKERPDKECSAHEMAAIYHPSKTTTNVHSSLLHCGILLSIHCILLFKFLANKV